MVTGPVTRIRVSDTLAARVAARRALAVPGVLELQADPGQAVLGVAGSVLGPAAWRPPPGAAAEVRDGTVSVQLAVVTRVGRNCRDLAHAVQREVAADVTGFTGLPATVTVTVTEVLIRAG